MCSATVGRVSVCTHLEHQASEGTPIEPEVENVVLPFPSVKLPFSSGNSKKFATQIRLSTVL